MIQIERETQKISKPPTTEEEIKGLKDTLKEKEATINELREQVTIVQVALDELIFGGMI